MFGSYVGIKQRQKALKRNKRIIQKNYSELTTKSFNDKNCRFVEKEASNSNTQNFRFCVQLISLDNLDSHV